MYKKLLGAAAMAAVAYTVVSTSAVVAVSAANTAGCSGENLGKTESATEAMADGAGKIAAQKEVARAQEALLSGKMGACAMHLSRAMQAGTMNQAPYESTMNQARPKPQPRPRTNRNLIGNRSNLRCKPWQAVSPGKRADREAIGPFGRGI